MSHISQDEKKSDTAVRGSLLKKLRFITVLLILSVSINILFVSLSVYSFLAKVSPVSSPSLYHFNLLGSLASTDQRTNSDVFTSFLNLTCAQLLEKLNSKETLEDGYSERDLALACLVHYHYFDVKRALNLHQIPLQTRTLYFDLLEPSTSRVQLTVFPGLTDAHFTALIHFAHTERWPLTDEGLFAHLKAQMKDPDPELADAFCLTRDFVTLETLLSRSSNRPIARKKLLKMLLCGSWPDLHQWASSAVNSALSPQESRRSFLLTYIQLGSEEACDLFLKTDMDFALRKLKDSACIQLLHTLTHLTPEAVTYCQQLLSSPRSDSVLAAAQDWLKVNQPLDPQLKKVPLTYDLSRAQGEMKSEAPPRSLFKGPKEENRSIQEKLAKNDTLKKSREKPIIYTVKEGDTLWAIARRLGADIDDLKKANELHTDFLTPGLQLKVP